MTIRQNYFLPLRLWLTITRLSIAGLTGLLLAGCSAITAIPPDAVPPEVANLAGSMELPVVERATTPTGTVHQEPFAARTACSATFVTHVLKHETSAPTGMVRMFEANGSGLAVGDLDQDGLPDLVAGNYHGSNTILWNEGALNFAAEPFGEGGVRAITLVDVDGDGRLDIVLTRVTGAINYWRNQGERSFVQEVLPGVSRPASVLNWADMDGDGDLDLVTGSYDAGLITDVGTEYMLQGGGGVYYYENRGFGASPNGESGGFVATQLAIESQAMAIALVDLTGSGRPDILVGNDFAVPDYSWSWQAGAWQPFTPFNETTHSTMSFDIGDLNNDGALELFATDMKPYANDPATEAAWAPVMAAMMDGNHSDMGHPEGDPQVMENVLQAQGPRATYANVAAEWAIDATGWSWSAKFGDLDQDGYLDLYVVNGMMEERLFAHLPNHELVEENQILRNKQGTGFEPAPEWQLNSRESGRSLVLVDMDGDGDLDIVVNNMRGPLQLFENQLCTGSSLQVQLRHPGSGNTFGLGAHLFLHTDQGVYRRDLRAASGYLSGDAPLVHFGFPTGAILEQLEIHWPDGEISTITDLRPEHLLTLTRP
jgi:enediyne biosynthesis protein E4